MKRLWFFLSGIFLLTIVFLLSERANAQDKSILDVAQCTIDVRHQIQPGPELHRAIKNCYDLLPERARKRAYDARSSQRHWCDCNELDVNCSPYRPRSGVAGTTPLASC